MNTILMETENQLAAMPPVKRWGVLAFTALAIAVGGWYFWIVPMREEIAAQEAKIAQLRHRLAQNRTELLKKRIKKQQLINLTLKERIESYRTMRMALERGAKSLELFFFKPVRFMEMFEKILQKTVALGIRVDEVRSEQVKGEISPLIEKKRRVVIEGAAPFKAVTKLTWYIESFNALMKIVRYRFWYDEEAQEPRFVIEMLYLGAKE